MCFEGPPTLSLVWTSNVSSSERWWFVSLIAQIGGASSIPIRRQQHVVPLRPRSREREEWFSASEREVRRRRNRCLFLPILSLSSILSVLPNLRPSSSSFSSFVQKFLFCQVDHGLFFSHSTQSHHIIFKHGTNQHILQLTFRERHSIAQEV